MVRGNLPARVNVELDLADDLHSVEADIGQIEQVLLNLLVNAIEAVDAAGREGGLIRVSTANEVVAQIMPRPPQRPQAQHCVRVSVIDTGEGMSPETLERVFEPFFSTKFQGRGLGLAASSGIIRNHGGVIWAQSTPGQGSVFHVLLPALWHTSAELPEEQESQGSAGRTVLVIDDDPDALHVTSRMLESRNYNVLSAASGNEGLAAWRAARQKIDLVLLDMQMPDLSGPEVLERIRQEDSRVRVLICSGFAPDANIAQLAGKDVSGFITKPFGPRELTRAVENALAPRNAEPDPARG
jgi:CheY-like chemotaxis protein